ncbi:hypothetical protein IIA95_01100 [Patescibacteria group bacterium]|nr:hypothetical protein [Patescibacteria group bacterium]
MSFPREHFHFFGNREMNSLYMTIGLLYFAEGLMGIFIPIYFWKLGFPLWKILFFYFLISFSFVLILFAALPAIRKLSDKMMMFLSIPFLVAYFFGLTYLADIPFLFYILPIMAAAGSLLFNVGYHIDFSGTADDGYIGREVGMRYMVGSLAQFAAPLAGGFLIAFLGFGNNFFIGSAILLLAVLPLFFFPKRNFSRRLNYRSVLRFLKDKALMPFTISGFGYATETTVGQVIWPLFIFLSVGSIENYGAVISGGLLVGAVVTYLVGFLSDHGRRRKTLAWSASALAAIWALRPFFLNPFIVSASQAGGAGVKGALMVSWSSQYYKIARAIPNHETFILSREMLYHLARMLFLPFLMLASYLFSSSQFFTFSFIIAALLSLLFLFANRFHLQPKS